MRDADDAYDRMTAEIERVETLLDVVIEAIGLRTGPYREQVILECAREKLARVREHGTALLSGAKREPK
ncbi:MAG TPA: hypothetical protein VFA27_02520 [Vicinamibacterales bacterium]|nr:hypothetical protein [Vicinamibacterales bacterium]